MNIQPRLLYVLVLQTRLQVHVQFAIHLSEAACPRRLIVVYSAVLDRAQAGVDVEEASSSWRWQKGDESERGRPGCRDE